MTQNIVDLVDSQIRRAELTGSLQAGQKLSGEHPVQPVITISRELGSGGRRVAEIVSHKLEFSLWDAELVEKVANDASVAQKLVDIFDERVVSEIEILLRHIAGEPKIGGFQYKKHLSRAILQIGRLGNAVILGRGANFILAHALNVRIIASKDLRVHNMIEFEGLSKTEAIRRIEESDRLRSEFTRRLWGRDWSDPLYYDMVFRMDEITNDNAADLICRALEQRISATAK